MLSHISALDLYEIAIPKSVVIQARWIPLVPARPVGASITHLIPFITAHDAPLLQLLYYL